MRRFPHTTRTWQQAGNDGKTYRVTAKVYTAVLRSPQDVWFYMLIESPDGTRRELHGEREVRPVMERIWDEQGKRVCKCQHTYAEHDKWPLLLITANLEQHSQPKVTLSMLIARSAVVQSATDSSTAQPFVKERTDMPRRCHYRHPRFEDGQCPRPARRGQTMCASHASAGGSYVQWKRNQEQKAKRGA